MNSALSLTPALAAFCFDSSTMSGLYSMPIARAPRLAAVMTVRPSPEPRSITKSCGVTFAMSSILSTSACGVGTQTTSLPRLADLRLERLLLGLLRRLGRGPGRRRRAGRGRAPTDAYETQRAWQVSSNGSWNVAHRARCPRLYRQPARIRLTRAGSHHTNRSRFRRHSVAAPSSGATPCPPASSGGHSSSCSLLPRLSRLARRPLGRDSYPRQPGIDVLGYVFSIELNDDTAAISAEADIDVALRTDGVRESPAGPRRPLRRRQDRHDGQRVTSGSRTLAFTHEAQPAAASIWARVRNPGRSPPASPSATPARRPTACIIGRNRHGERVFFGDNFPDRAGTGCRPSTTRTTRRRASSSLSRPRPTRWSRPARWSRRRTLPGTDV